MYCIVLRIHLCVCHLGAYMFVCVVFSCVYSCLSCNVLRIHLCVYHFGAYLFARGLFWAYSFVCGTFYAYLYLIHFGAYFFVHVASCRQQEGDRKRQDVTQCDCAYELCFDRLCVCITSCTGVCMCACVRTHAASVSCRSYSFR